MRISSRCERPFAAAWLWSMALAGCGSPTQIGGPTVSQNECSAGASRECNCEGDLQGTSGCDASGHYASCVCDGAPDDTLPHAGSGGGDVMMLPPSQATDDDAGALPSDLPVHDAGALGEDEECYELRAHDDVTHEAFNVPANTWELYYCWSFPVPWQGEVEGISFRSKIDEERVVHHWLLYQSVVPQQAVGTPCIGAHPDAALLAGWAPGASDNALPPDVGMQLGNAGFILEFHYNNATTENLKDASGVEVCVTRKPRTHKAAVHWLGTPALALPGPGDVLSNCSPNYAQGPITILSSWPHMHLKGSHMKSEIIRVSGAREMLHDAPFDFNYQISYPTPAVLQPGDRIETTCSYFEGPVIFGEGTGNEMCFNFVTAYPAGALSGAGFTANQCFL